MSTHTTRRELSGLFVITIRYNLSDEELLNKIQGTLDGGAQIIELREKNMPHTRLVKFAERVKKITEKYKVPLIVNDYPEVAVESGADGVHLGQYDPLIAEARKILNRSSIIGASAYNSIQRALKSQQDGADYVAMSSPFPSISKPLKKLTPPEIIRETKRRLKIPLFVIGGITPENAHEIMSLGVDGIAVMSGIFNEENTEKATRKYREALEKI
jgi:thiamine-phosphate pyrophosphorylase